MTTLEQVKAVVMRELEISDPKLVPDGASFVALGFDSLEYLELMQEIEEELKVELLQDDYPRLMTISAVAAYADQKRKD